MSRSDWRGVIPAITTPFDAGLAVDHAFLARHAAWMVDAGCTGIVAAGSLGEGATLSHDERAEILRTLIGAVGDRVPIIATVSALSTAEAVRIAGDAQAAGCRGLMVLPPYVYRGDWRETRAHFTAVIRATDLSCMLYNNPIAYGTDVTPSQVAELAVEFPSLHAVKESSADVRRVTAIRSLLGDRLSVLVGVDDLIAEGISAGAEGWIAGLVNAMPAESVALFNLAREAARGGDWSRATALYRWFLPLLRLDVVPEFVHLIKLVQQEVGMGSERVRPPRLELAGEAREEAIEVIRTAIMTKPAV
ncbi:MAG: dihydrodipicolinate synthase family protein [Phycisphaerae bacterium]|nr:dihydrodipicolinate synthase family protein [Phycisphaerae bacterium]